ncbi:MAG TPA: hypothetical protein VEK57_30220 [Thermoanaerobaculia bacterium]|nr:hypothetical protein [Thermoanaerobaculia bacterium]
MPHTRPAKGVEVVCSTCIAPNTGKKTAAFNDPLIRYVGRYVDSSTTPNVQNLGMRTVRAQRVRVSHALKRIFVKYAETIAGFSFDQFLANVAVADLPKVGVMKTGNTSPSRPKGTEVELVARPNTFFYAEAAASGWEVQRLDTQEVLTDFDVDDVGFVYVGTLSFGWGISKDEKNETQIPLHMVKRVQLKDAPITPHSVIFMKVGAVPFAVISATVVSANASSMLIYDTSDRANPVLKQTRKGKPNSISVWARFEPGKRLAAVTADGKLRIHAYDTFITGGAPLVEVAPTATRKTFRDLSFDEKGTLWAIESDGTAPVAGNKLWQFIPTAAGYTQKQHDVFGTPFAPQQLAARKGYVAVGGIAAGSKTELRLYRMTGAVPQFVDTGNFFFRYYHDKTPPAGFASASTYVVSTTSLKALHILDHNGKVYMLYSADGLGDVYELQPV